jgi:hypothetical protein
MSLMFFIFSGFLSLAQSCPDLSGHYQCSQGSRKFILMISSDQLAHTVVREGREVIYRAHGQKIAIPDTDSYQKGQHWSSCVKNKLQVNFQVELLYEGSVIAKQKTVSIFEKMERDLILTEKTRMKGISLPSQRFVCKAN